MYLFHLPIRLCDYLSVSLSMCLSVYLYTYVSIYPSIHHLIFTYLSTCRAIYLWNCLPLPPVYLYVSICIYLPIYLFNYIFSRVYTSVNTKFIFKTIHLPEFLYAFPQSLNTWLSYSGQNISITFGDTIAITITTITRFPFLPHYTHRFMTLPFPPSLPSPSLPLLLFPNPSPRQQ